MSYFLSRSTHAPPRSSLRRQFEAFIRNKTFPCVGAKAALSKGQMTVVIARDIVSAWDDLRLHEEIRRFADAYDKEPALFSSFAIVFRSPRALTELEFETALWERLQSLHDKDVWMNYTPDKSVATDPTSKQFSFSVAGKAFFVVGLHANASRPGRRFSNPTIVFNPHDQFVRLRESGQYYKLKDAILDRDRRFNGSINPMLEVHGEKSEARQYSGREVDDAWAAPYRTQF